MTQGGQHRPAETNAAGGEIPTLIIVSVVIMTTILISAVTVLTILDKPVDNVLVIVGAFIAPTVTSLLASRKLDKVARQVNGKMDNLITDKAVLEHQVSSLGIAPATLPARRVTDTDRTDTSPLNRRVHPNG